MKQLFLDLETTGTRHELNGIHQIAGEIVIDGEVQETFNLKPRPFESDTLDFRALELGGVTEEELWARELSPEEAKRQLASIFSKYVDAFNPQDKFEMVGYNVDFDDEFLRSWWKKAGDDYYGSWVYFPVKDVAQMVARVVGEDRIKLKNFKLETVAEYFEVSPPDGKYHDASVDILVTRLLHDKLEKRIRLLPDRASVVGNIGDAIRHFLSENTVTGTQELAKWLHENSNGVISESDALVLATLELG